MLKDWQPIKTASKIWPALEIDGKVWRVVDEIVPLDKASETTHAFAIHGAKDAYPHRATQKYPDSTVVTDAGYGQLEGTFAFTVHDLVPGRPIVILHRIEYIMGNYTLAVLAGGKPAGEVVCDGADRTYRWRNLPVPIAAEHVTGTSLSVELRSLTPGRDVHMFHVWVFQ